MKEKESSEGLATRLYGAMDGFIDFFSPGSILRNTERSPPADLGPYQSSREFQQFYGWFSVLSDDEKNAVEDAILKEIQQSSRVEQPVDRGEAS